MLRNRLAGLALIGLVTSAAGCGTVEVAQAADEKPAAAAPKETGKNVAEAGSEVAFPELPKGAGKMDDNAPKKFTTTESGLKYRVLRAGTDPKPTARQSVDSPLPRLARQQEGLRQLLRTRGDDLLRTERGDPRLDRRNAEGRQGRDDRTRDPCQARLRSTGAGAAVPPNATLHFLVELKDIK